jgi:AAA+ ATPase superfamily predicted ATPase
MSRPGALLGRAGERARLEKAWQASMAGEPQLGVVWGRRRVGKTFLLSHFARGKRCAFFAATQQAEAIELRRFAEVVRRDLGDEVGDLSGDNFASWEAALRFLSVISRDEPLLVVLDEVPYLTRSTPGFSSIVQATWDHVRPSKLMLVLTGSAVGTIEEMLGAGGALRGRPAVAMRLDPFDLPGARAFLPKLSEVDFFCAYAACGGYPLHLQRWDENLSVEENLSALAGTAGGVLLEDAASILSEELSDSGGYPRILAAIGRGRTRMSEIQTDADQRVEHPLDVLIRAGFVRRSLPVGSPKASRPLYEIDDVYLAFWFSVLYSDLAFISAGQGGPVLRRRQPAWQRHLGWVFEEAARAHAVRLVAAGKLPKDLVVGRWWSVSGEQCEVDVLGLTGSRTALLGEARWQETPLGMRDLTALSAKLRLVPKPSDEPLFVLWGRAGVESTVKRAGAIGFGLKDVLRQ